MSTVVYDTRRIFFPTGSGGSGGSTSADKVSIKINPGSEVSKAKNVQEAVQMVVDNLNGAIVNLPPENLSDDANVNDIIQCINTMLDAFRNNIKEPKNDKSF